MPQRSIEISGESEIDHIERDLTTIYAEVDKGIDPITFPNQKIYEEKIRTVSVNNYAFYMGNIANNSWGNATLDLTTNFGATPQFRILQNAFADIFVNTSGATPTLPNLSTYLYATELPYPYSNGHVGTAGGVGLGLGGGAALDARDQFDFQMYCASQVSSSYPSKLALARYVFSFHNMTGAAADVFIVFSAVLMGGSTFS